MIPIANPDISDAAKAAVKEVLDSGMIADGPEVRDFEDRFAEYGGAEHGVGVANGTAALHAAFEGLGIGDGDTVLVPSMSFVATANAVRLAGARPVFADVDPETYNLDPEAVETVLADHDVDAIVAVHLYGLPAPMDELRALADEHDAWLVEDAAQAHGATYRGDPIGGLGDVACFSFYPTKNMTTGEGGMILAADDDVVERIRAFVNHGRDGKYEHATVGHNFRMTSIAAAIGKVQLDRLPDMVATRRRNANLLDDGLEDTSFEPPTVPEYAEHAYHQYTIRVDDQEAFVSAMEERDVGASVYYPTPIHQQPAYDHVDVSLPETEAAASTVVSLPVHHNVTADDCRRIVDAVEQYDA